MKEIIKNLGKNHTDPVVFDNKNLGVSAIYTFEGEVYCLHDGMDFSFESVDQDIQNEILVELEAKRYVVDDTFQG